MTPIESYKEEIRLYQIWIKKMKSQYGDLSVMAWDEPDYQEVLQRNYGLKLVEKVLGLSKEEVEKIEKEVERELI
jgi:hypothetical protein